MRYGPVRQHPGAVRPQMRTFRCPVCGMTTTATKCKGRTRIGHIKTMWCWVCQADSDMVQEDE